MRDDLWTVDYFLAWAGYSSLLTLALLAGAAVAIWRHRATSTRKDTRR